MKPSKLKVINDRFYLKELCLSLLFLAFIMQFQWFETIFSMILGPQKDAVEWSPLYVLAMEYMMVVAISSLASLTIAFSLGSLVHLFKLKGLEALLLTLANFGTTFPSVAVIALLVPLLGYGVAPVILALIIYGILPILTNTLLGLSSVDSNIRLAASGMGMTPFQQYLKVDLPLATTYIIAGVKTSFIINIAAATVGSIVGAGGLGMPIISGIRTNEPILILKGAIPVAIVAILADGLFTRLERKYEWNKPTHAQN